MENFFGTLKTKCLHRIRFSCSAGEEQSVGEYGQFYNYERINMKDGLTPSEIRSKAASIPVILRQDLYSFVRPTKSCPRIKRRAGLFFGRIPRLSRPGRKVFLLCDSRNRDGPFLVLNVESGRAAGFADGGNTEIIIVPDAVDIRNLKG